MSTIEIAMQFASLGYFVFPLYKNSKGEVQKPYGWARNVVTPDKEPKAIPATNDPSQVSNWPTEVKNKYKKQVSGFGVLGLEVVILDLDVKGEKTGFADFTALAKEYTIPKPTMITKSKSGGLHLFYKKPSKYSDQPIKTFSGLRINDIEYSGIDVRGDGGFVVGPEMLVEDLNTVELGSYGMTGLIAPGALPEFPPKLMPYVIKSHTESDLDNMTLVMADETDYRTFIRRGEIPPYIPKGARNDSFYVFVNVLRSKGISIDTTRIMCQQMTERVGEPETLDDSVDIEQLLQRIYDVKEEIDPKKVAADLIQRGLFQITGYKSTLHYSILEDNPYIVSKGLHDETAMKTLLLKYQKPYLKENGKEVQLNPIQVITKIIGNENRVDMIGFKPNAGEVFSLHDEPGSKRFLNTYRPLVIQHEAKDLNMAIWDEFQLLLSRLFGEPDSSEYLLGLDYICWLVQCPEIKPSIAPFIISTNRGVGKSLMFNVLMSIMGTTKTGEHQARMVKLDELTGRFFNPSGCLVNLIDEVQFPVHSGMRKESSAFWRHLKTLITSETISVEIKGGITYQCPNTAAIALAGNAGQYFPIEEFDRRLWVIDSNPPLLKNGEVDNLFDLVKRSRLNLEDRSRSISTLRYMLKNYKIQNNLASIRAPMTAAKQELYENGLTDIEEWFVTHFSNPGNVFANTPIVSQSAVSYVFSMSPLANDKDSLTFFRSLKRKGHLRPIRVSKTVSSSKQFTVPTIGLDGSLIKSGLREVLYTTRDHHSFDAEDTTKILEQFHQNCITIQRFRTQQAQRVVKVSGDELLKGAK